jgi:hypothetical protein
MNYVYIDIKQNIILRAKRNSTITQALYEAIEFAKEHNTDVCTLIYDGFSFDIEDNSDIKEKVKEYEYYLIIRPK